MSRRNTRTSARRFGAGIAAIAIGGVFMPTGSQALAADDDVDVVNTETVKVYLSADGKVDTKRVYEQLEMTGDGDVQFGNPIETSGLRNLDGFDDFDVEDGEQEVEMSVDGVERLRTVSDYTGDLPLEVDVEYRLDGESVDAEDIAGEDGALEVIYTVKNVTAKPQEITYADGRGGTITEIAEVPIPMVGSLSTVLPSNFTQVKSEQANMAGDGKGGTKMSFTMTLVPPIGSDTATFGYTAQIEDGEVPPASISALPVNPLASPTFKTAATSYKGGAKTGATLTAGAVEIDANLLKIRDGAAALLAGLIQLSAGADELSAGLVDKAAPGAQELAVGASDLSDGLGLLKAGAGQLDDGAGKLDDGAGKLSDGADKLSGGTGKALTGSQKLNAGLKQISGGLDQLADTEGLPKAAAGVEALQTGVDQILAGFGSVGTTGTLIDGLDKLEAGSATLEGGLRQLRGSATPTPSGLTAAKGGVDSVQSGLAAAVSPGGSLDQLFGGLESLKVFCDADEPACTPTIGALQSGVTTSKTNLSAANQGLLQVSAGLGQALTGLDTQLIPGAVQINAGLTDAKAGAVQLKGGTQQVAAGLDQLEVGLTKAVSGVLQLSDGADAAETGSGDLASGLFKLDTGAGQLASGADELAGGAGLLADGTGELSTGAGEAMEGSILIANGSQELSTGLNEAAAGSELLAEGLTKATTSAPALPEGADRLSEEGMSKLVAAGKSTAKEYGQLYAIVGAGSERAQAESMAYGAPDDASGLTAYSFEIRGEDGEDSRNFKRALGAVLIAGLGMGAFVLRRRMI